MHPTDAARQAIEDNQWVKLETRTGEVVAKVLIQDSMKEGHVRVPHGWWYPEIKSPDHGWDVSNINLLTDNSHDSMDPIMGATNLRVLLCRISRCEDLQEN